MGRPLVASCAALRLKVLHDRMPLSGGKGFQGGAAGWCQQHLPPQEGLRQLQAWTNATLPRQTRTPDMGADSSGHQRSRAALLDGAGRGGPPQETAATAGLDNRGIVQLQQSLMREQDSQVCWLHIVCGSQLLAGVTCFTGAPA